MKRGVLIALAFVMVLAVVLAGGQPTGALPEYSEQTGEPCAGCHISPSGGGLRTPRGQAWVGSGRPGVVPGLTDALALLGVRLTIDEADFVAVPGEVQPAEPLRADAAAAGDPVGAAPADAAKAELAAWLRMYAGN